MSVKEVIHLTSENAEVISGAAVATGGYLYFNKVRGFVRPVVGCVVTFTGGCVFYDDVQALLHFSTAEAAAFASASTLGVLFAIQRAAFHLNVGAIFRKGE